MKFIRVVDGPITSRWDEPRPLSNPGLWNHGSVDIGAVRSSPLLSPEGGWPYAFAIFRPEGRRDEWEDPLKNGQVLPWGNMRHDVFGAITVLKGESGYYHLFTHSYFNQVFEKEFFPKGVWHYQEEKPDRRFQLYIFHTFGSQRHVMQGEQIGFVGNAGLSKGPHVHWTIMTGWERTKHEDRIDPEKYLEA